MAIPVKLSDIVDELDMQSDEVCCFINRMTGEIAHVGHDDFDDLVRDEVDLPADTDLAMHLEESDDWHSLPTKFDIHDWDIMHGFSMNQDDPIQSELLEAVHGVEAFRMFRSTLDRLGLTDGWHQYRNSAYTKIATDALDELGIPYEVD
jgi:hypothetical protein